MPLSTYNPGTSFIVKSPLGIRVHPITNSLIGHQGVDYAKAPGITTILGLPISAAANGVVVDKGFQQSSNGTGWGNYVVLEHTREDGTKFQTLYAHLNVPSPLGMGQGVFGGEPVGAVGQSGGASGPHIHFEVIVGGNARPLTMGGTSGTRVDGTTFTNWGGLPHMVGTDPTTGNILVAQTTGSRGHPEFCVNGGAS